MLHVPSPQLFVSLCYLHLDAKPFSTQVVLKLKLVKMFLSLLFLGQNICEAMQRSVLL